MLENIVYIILAIIGLGFLVFIHELGHFFVARRLKMKVEVFSIGFGKAIFSWQKKGVRWQIGIFPFGGFVKIAGMEKKGKKEPYQIKDGFFAKKPIDRIKVAFAGPCSNFLFAFLAFFIIWSVGGRKKPFSEHTKKIGWIDQSSDLYEKEIRAGDEIIKYNNKRYQGFKDILYASVLKKNKISIEGNKINYYKNLKKPFNYEIPTYLDKSFKGFSTIGIKAPASFLIYEKPPENILKISPMRDSNIKNGDRIMWINGDLVFSLKHLSHLVNEKNVFLTIKRDNKIFYSKIPLLKLSDLKLSSDEIDEIEDWKYELDMEGELKDFYFIPYFFNEDKIIVRKLNFFDEEDKPKIDKRNPYCIDLEKGDEILKINGIDVASSHSVLKIFQKRAVLIIVARQNNKDIFWKEGDKYFDKAFKNKEIFDLVLSKNRVEDLYLLNPVFPIKMEKFLSRIENKEFLSFQKKIKEIKNSKERKQLLELFEKEKKKLILGIPNIKDKMVKYNINPFSLFYKSFLDTWHTLFSLISGKLSPKWLVGPLGIVQVVKTSWSLGVLEAIFWLGVISLNLGFINLLPLPVLDGGYIIFSIVEMITKKPIKSKTMEKLIIPFIILLILLFIFITYNDFIRLIKRFF
ncbi:MAG: hypothetical protein AMS24_01685 [Chlamydiae bacterium SM23_39]|nr:MAG: hypothetical protein AMS24_01685 [Chlamydiae bacterium SM23_39]